MESTSKTPNPFNGIVQRAIPENTTKFLMLYYLPEGESAGHITTTGKTYYTSWKSPNGEVASLGVLNYASRTRGRPAAYSYKSHQNGFSLSGNSIINYPTSSSSFSSDRFIMKEKPLTSNSGHTSYEMIEELSDLDGVVFQLEQVNTNIPKDQIYSGVWYRMSINHNIVLPPVFDLSGEVGAHPFPHNNTTEIARENASLLSSAESPWVLFIPYSKDLSYWTGGSCIPVGSSNTAMLMYNDWILTDFSKSQNSEHTSVYEQKHCYGHLGKNSKFCAYVGKGCNGGLGYNYCKTDEKCGKCFGGCTKGSCVWDSLTTTSTHFYCAAEETTASSHTDTGVTTVNKSGNSVHKKSSKSAIFIAVGLLVIMMLVLVIYFYSAHTDSGGSLGGGTSYGSYGYN